MNWIDELRRLLRRANRDLPADTAPGGISCPEVAERILEWLDGELDSEVSERIRVHLEACARCYPMLLFEKSFRQALTRAAGDEGAPDDLRDRILKRLDDEKQTPS